MYQQVNGGAARVGNTSSQHPPPNQPNTQPTDQPTHLQCRLAHGGRDGVAAVRAPVLPPADRQHHLIIRQHSRHGVHAATQGLAKHSDVGLVGTGWGGGGWVLGCWCGVVEGLVIAPPFLPKICYYCEPM